jgi:hypothetical protein
LKSQAEISALALVASVLSLGISRLGTDKLRESERGTSLLGKYVMFHKVVPLATCFD